MPAEFQLPNENIDSKNHNFEHGDLNGEYSKLFIVFFFMCLM